MHNTSSITAVALDSEARLTLIEAIARRRAVAARYNGAALKLAPHLLFERRGDLFVKALNLSKTRRADDVPQLGQFKLAGLAATELLEEHFDPLPEYQPRTPNPDDTLVLTV